MSLTTCYLQFSRFKIVTFNLTPDNSECFALRPGTIENGDTYHSSQQLFTNQRFLSYQSLLVVYFTNLIKNAFIDFIFL